MLRGQFPHQLLIARRNSQYSCLISSSSVACPSSLVVTFHSKADLVRSSRSSPLLWSPSLVAHFRPSSRIAEIDIGVDARRLSMFPALEVSRGNCGCSKVESMRHSREARESLQCLHVEHRDRYSTPTTSSRLVSVLCECSYLLKRMRLGQYHGSLTYGSWWYGSWWYGPWRHGHGRRSVLYECKTISVLTVFATLT